MSESKSTSTNTPTSNLNLLSTKNVFFKTFLVGTFYFASSSMALIANKVALKYVPAPAFFMGVQYLFSVLFCVLGGLIGFLDVNLCPSFNQIKNYSIVPVFFAVAIFSNAKMLESANVETFLVVRFSTCIFVACADFLVMGKALPNIKSWLGMIMIVAGAIVYAYVESSFKAVLGWAITYVLVITVEMIVVKHVFTVQEMSTWTRVYLNNGLSIPLQPFFAWMTNERVFWTIDWSSEALGYLLISCLCGLTLAYSGTALRHLVSATTFTVAGIVCKILTIFGNILVLPDQHAGPEGLAALGVSFVGSLLYSPASARSRNENSVSERFWTGLDVVSFGCLGKLQLENASTREVSTSSKEASKSSHLDEEKIALKSKISGIEEGETERTKKTNGS